MAIFRDYGKIAYIIWKKEKAFFLIGFVF